MSNKELTPIEAYAALLEGKVIERGRQQLAINEVGLCERYHPSVLFDKLPPEQHYILLPENLKGYRLVKGKRKVKIEVWVNFYEYQGSLIRKIYEHEHQAAIANDVPDGKCLVRAYKIEKEIEVEV